MLDMGFEPQIRKVGCPSLSSKTYCVGQSNFAAGPGCARMSGCISDSARPANAHVVRSIDSPVTRRQAREKISCVDKI